MRRAIALIGAAAGVAMLAAGALAQTASRENGVTVLRGPPGTQSTNTAAAANPAVSPATPAPALSGSSVNRGTANATITGSENAGGVIGNPPPGAGQ